MKKYIELIQTNFEIEYLKNKKNMLLIILEEVIIFLTLLIIFKYGLKIGNDVNGFSYALWMIVGIVQWTYVKNIISNSLKNTNKGIIEQSIIINGTEFTRYFISLYFLVIIFRIFGYTPDIYMTQLLIYMILSILFLESISIFILCFNKDEFIKKIIYILNIPFLTISSFFLNKTIIKEKLISKIININPVSYMINGLRNIFINKKWIWGQPKALFYFVTITLIIYIADFILLKIKKNGREKK